VSLEKPDGRWVGDSYRVTYPKTGIRIDYDRFTYTVSGIMVSAVVRRIERGQTYLLTRTRYNLETSDRLGPILVRINQQARGHTHLEDVNWSTVMEAAGAMALDAFRTGTPAKKASAIVPLTLPRYFLKPYVGARPTTVAAAGGTGKTWFGMAAAITAAQSGKNIVGWRNAPPCNVLYGDWEGDEQLFWKRVMALLIGNGVDESAIRDTLFYRNLRGVPLIEAAGSLSRECDDLGIGFCVWDSLFYACGGALTDPKAVGDCFTAAGRLKSLYVPANAMLPIPQLFITHLTKSTMQNEREIGKRTSPFGTVFIENGSDYVFSMEQPTQTGGIDDDDTPEKFVLVTTEKVNNGRFTKAHAYRILFTNDPSDPDETAAVEFQRVEPLDVPDFAEKLPLTSRVLGTLRGGVRLTPLAIAEAAGMVQHLQDEDEDEEKRVNREQRDFRGKIRVAISRLAQRGRIYPFQDGTYGLAANHASFGQD
jgi:hypothetical protein